MTAYFDTQPFVRRMEAAGMERPIAEELADLLGTVVLAGLATERTIQDVGSGIRTGVRELELQLRKELKELELRVTLRMGAISAGVVAILGALQLLK